MHVVISPGDINSLYGEINKENIGRRFCKYFSQEMPCSRENATAYMVPVEVLTFKIIQGE